MHKTLQARITEDLQDHRQRSRFVRASKGVYFLRRLTGFRPSSKSFIGFKGRRRPLPDCRILQLKSEVAKSVFTHRTLDSRQTLFALPLEYGSVEEQGSVPVALLIFISYHDLILAHRIGRHSYFASLVGQRSLGFRSYIDEFDSDLFFSSEFGLPISAVREILRNLDIPSRAASDLVTTGRDQVQLGLPTLDLDGSRILITAHVDIANLMPERPRIIRRLDIASAAWVPRWQLPKKYFSFYQDLLLEFENGKKQAI
jgi:hypothetical protein